MLMYILADIGVFTLIDMYTYLYLPFADVDKRMAEIVSKIFLLVSDDKITDKTILEQIRGAGWGIMNFELFLIWYNFSYES